MLAWSTQINTIMNGTLTKILRYLGQKINRSEKKITKKMNKIKYQFFHFYTLFSHILQSYLNTFFYWG